MLRWHRLSAFIALLFMLYMVVDAVAGLGILALKWLASMVVAEDRRACSHADAK